MIDFSAIEAEIKTLTSSVTAFKTVETGRIRETVATAQMPSIDISIQGHEYKRNDPEAAYKMPCLLVIRRMGFDRTADADAFKLLIEQLCAAFEGVKGSTYNVIRNISSQIQEGDSGNGSVIRVGVIQITLWA